MTARSRQTGVLVEKQLTGGRVRRALRFHAYGKREYLTLPDGTSREDAQQQLRHVLADVERGLYLPHSPPPEPPPIPQGEPTFHQFALDWYRANEGHWRRLTCVDYQGALAHLLPFFRDHLLSQITASEVDRYKTYKVAEARQLAEEGKRGLSPVTINKTITRLAQILELAVEYDHITRNPARGKHRRLKVSTQPAIYLDRADQITSLLDAAAELDRRAPHERKHIARRTMLATLVYGGLRMGEMLDLRWRHVDLAHGRLRVADSKTDAGMRTVELLPGLREILADHRAGAAHTRPDDLVFPTATGKRHGNDNIRNRVFRPAVKLADQAREQAGLTPLPQRLAPHKLRHTAISLWFACGWDPIRVKENAGHADLATTSRIYAHVMSTDPGERAKLRALVDGVELAPTGTETAVEAPSATGFDTPVAPELPANRD